VKDGEKPERRPRYHWAGVSRQSRGRAGDRLQHLEERRGLTTPTQLQAAVVQRRAQMARLAPAGDPDLWMPIGPTVVLDGQAGGRPRVSGRANDIWVSPDGQRAYVATANGGVWFSSDRGETWSPLGGWAVTAAHPPQAGPSNVLVCGCLLVNFKATAATDEVLVGTGELIPSTSGTPGSQNSGVGILRKVGPAVLGEFAQVWDIEGTNLAGLATFRLAVDPSTPTTFVAATSGGLWTRTGGPTPMWTAVPAAPFNTAAGTKLICTDVIWSPAGGGVPARLWVAVRDDVGGSSGLFVSTNGTAGPFTPIPLPGLLAKSRTTMAVAPSNPSVVYALSEGNLMWRLDGSPPVVRSVQRVPPNLLGSGGQPAYNQAIDVHPTRPERIMLGGATELANGQWSASLYLADVNGPVGGNYQFGFTAGGGNPTTDASFIGNGVHPDVHCARFVAVPGATELWVGCDGGVFRSQQGDADNRVVKNSFVSRNTGIASLECGYVATHPVVDGYTLAGTQDNGTLERVGDTVWRLRFAGDGGGVAFNPAAPHAVLYQYTQSAWRRDGAIAAGAYTRPVLRTTGSSATGTAPEQSEDGNASFYSGCDAFLVPAAGAAAAFPRFAFGTTRVWFTADWGTNWRTLPSLTDPMAPGAQNINTDPTVTTGGAPDTARGQVIACRWASATRLLVLCARAVIQYDFVTDAGVVGGIRVTRTDLTRQSPQKKEDPQAAKAVVSPGQLLPAVGSWSDLATHLQSGGAHGGTHGTFYVATTGDPATPAMDTLWWFNGTDRWYATKLRNDAANGIAAPAYAVVVDNLDSNVVYVGTAVGVWKGTLNINGPSWAWQVLSNGLPEASVQDLTMVTAGGVRLLRAAVQARGVWDLDLNAPAQAQTFVRTHPYDTRRVTPTALVDPRQLVPNTALSWHASPDIRVRPVQGSKPPNPIGLPWNGNSPDAYGLWVFQTAIHTKPQGRACKANGQWTPMFDAILQTMTGGHRVTRAIWNANVGSGAAFPNAYAKPWDGALPTEADLLELIQDLSPPVTSTASIGMRPVHVNVDVLVHHRHLTPVPAAQVQVALLRRDVSGTNSAAWTAIAGGFTAAVQTYLRNGGAPPVLPDGWTFADVASPVRQVSGDVDARLPRAATFNVDFSALHKPARVLLLAVVHSQVDPVTLPSLSLQALVLGTRFVALRSVEIV
jgi:hypothetical protein